VSSFTEGSRPRRLYSAFAGHDGAANIVALLQARGIRPWLVLDEGGPIVTGQIPGVAGPVALVGVSEKLSVKVRCAIACAIVSLSTNGHKFDH
jgi:carboxypeptidase PM20D1